MRLRFLGTAVGSGCLVGLVAARALAAAPDLGYDEVPRVTATDPVFWREHFETARHSTLRIVVFGDSQETSPHGQGRYYLPWLNARFARIYGPVGESVLIANRNMVSPPQWLATARAAQDALPTTIPPERLPPAIEAVGLAQGPIRTVFLDDASRAIEPDLEAGPWFAAEGPVVADLVVAERKGSPPIRWACAPTDLDEPDDAAPEVASGTFDLAPPKGTPAGDSRLALRTTPVLSKEGRRHLQLRVSGLASKGASSGADLAAIRFRNTSHTRGVVVQSFARGGMRLPQLRAEHGAIGSFLEILDPSVIVLHYGANDAAGLSEEMTEWRAELLATIAWIRGILGDPAFPIILAGELRCGGSAVAFDRIDRMPAVAHEIALSDPRVLALNLRRVTAEEYGWATRMGPLLYLSDTAHLRPYAQRLLAEAFVGELSRALGIGDPACAAPNWADCVRVWGADCRSGGCVELIDWDVFANGLNWEGPGSTCDDLDGDGVSDLCPAGGAADLNRDGFVDAADLALILGAWGSSDPEFDLTDDGVVDAADLAIVLGKWGE